MKYLQNLAYGTGLMLPTLAFVCAFSLPAQAEKTADPAIEAGLAPHKALYDISLASTRSGSQIVNISGQMFYEWSSGCDAWNSNHRFSLSYEYADSPAMQIASDFSTYETFDGKSFDFTAQRKRDGALFEEVRGQAVIGPEEDGKVNYSIPKDLVYDLPSGALFPMAHTLEIIKAIEANKKFFKAVIFDGSDEDGPVEVNAFIGKTVNPMADTNGTGKLDTALINVPARKIRLAFFPKDNPEATAEYEMSLVFHQNGVISDMIIEYEDFTVNQKLIALEALAGTCEN